MSVKTILNNQLRQCGKTAQMLQNCILSATNNPQSKFLLCMPIRPQIPLPSNVVFLHTKNLSLVVNKFIGSDFTSVEIDHYIKDLHILDQESKIANLYDKLHAAQLEMEISRDRHRAELERLNEEITSLKKQIEEMESK